MGLGDVVPPSQLISIPSGEAGINATLKIMARLARQYKANPLVRQTAARAATSAGCDGRDDLCVAGALQRWTQQNITYLHDVMNVETLQTPDYTLQERYGDCDDQALLMASMLMSVDVPAAFCAVGIDGGPFTHVLTMAILRQHDQIVYSPLETIISKDPATNAAVGPGWFPPNATCQKFFHIT